MKGSIGMKRKICTFLLLSILFLTSCEKQTETKIEYKIHANEYQQFEKLDFSEISDDQYNYEYKRIDISSYLPRDNSEHFGEYCLDENNNVIFFSTTNDGSCKFYYLKDNNSEEIFDYNSVPYGDINDLSCFENHIFWTETLDTQCRIQCADINSGEIKTLFSGYGFVPRLKSDENGLYWSSYDSSNDIWSIFRSDGTASDKIVDEIYVSNQYAPFGLNNGNLSYFTLDNDKLIYNINDINHQITARLDLGVTSESYGAIPKDSSMDYICWENPKSKLDYSSIAAMIYNSKDNSTTYELITSSETVSKSCGVVNDCMYIHFSSDYNNLSNIYYYNFEDKKLCNITNNRDEDVQYAGIKSGKQYISFYSYCFTSDDVVIYIYNATEK